MYSQFVAVLFALSTSASAYMLPRNEGTVRCVTPEPSVEQLENSKALQKLETVTMETNLEAFSAVIAVNVYVHVVSSAESKYIDEKQIRDQLNYMNMVFGRSGASLTLVETDFTTNSEWAKGKNELAMKTSLRKGSYSDLNLYFVDSLEVQGEKALGYCPFPKPGVTPESTTFILDGCIVVAETVPGGSESPFNLGGTAVHEVGHWLNLYHTFQGGCESVGDMVFDTPAQKSPSSGCPKGRDSCGDLGLDPIHNFMDYSDDACYEEFTPGQTIRMHSSWLAYRV